MHKKRADGQTLEGLTVGSYLPTNRHTTQKRGLLLTTTWVARILLRFGGTRVFRRTWVFGCARIFGCAWVLDCARVFRRAGITRVAGITLTCNFGHHRLALFFPAQHFSFDFGSQRRDIGIQVHVFLGIGIHRLTAEKDGVSKVIHHADGGGKPGHGEPGVMHGRALQSRNGNGHPLTGYIDRGPPNGAAARMATSAS